MNSPKPENLRSSNDSIDIEISHFLQRSVWHKQEMTYLIDSNCGYYISTSTYTYKYGLDKLHKLQKLHIYIYTKSKKTHGQSFFRPETDSLSSSPSDPKNMPRADGFAARGDWMI